MDRGELRNHLDDAVGEREHPGVVRGDHDNPLTSRQLADQPQHLLDLNEVQVRRGFVGQDQRRVKCDRAGDCHPLLLTAAQVAGRCVIRSQSPPLTEAIASAAEPGAAGAAINRLRLQVERLEYDADGIASVRGKRAATSVVTSTPPNRGGRPAG